VHVADGIQFVKEIESSGVAQVHGIRNDCSYKETPLSESSAMSHTGTDIIIVDVDSSDPR